MRRCRDGFALTISFGLLLFIPCLVFGEEPGNITIKFPGLIYLVHPDKKDPLGSGTMTLDPNTKVWNQVYEDFDQFARVSPDGRLIAMNLFLKGAGPVGLHVIDFSGKKPPVRISETPRTGVVAWSADGKEILTAGLSPPRVYKYQRVGIDGTVKQKLPIAETARVFDWSPNGQWLAYVDLQKPERPVKIVHANGTGERLILASTDPIPEFGGTIGFRPRFSPDGHKLLFDTILFEKKNNVPVKAKRTSLLLADIETGKVEEILVRREKDLAFGACWSPDGKMLAVVVDEGEAKGVGEPRKSHVAIVSLEGEVLRSIPMPEANFARNVFEWR